MAFWGIFLFVDVEEQIEELRELVEKNIEVTEDTNRTIHKLRRSALWGFFFQIVWWLSIAGITGFAYYYFVQPQVDRIKEIYGVTQEQSEGFNNQVTSFVKYFTKPHGTSTTR